MNTPPETQEFEVSVDSEPEAEYKGILIHGKAVLPTIDQIDALARLITHIVRGAEKERQNA